MKTFLYSYNFHGARWDFEVPAGSKEEAEHRLVAMSSAQYDGELVCSRPDWDAGPAFWYGFLIGVVFMFVGSLVTLQLVS